MSEELEISNVEAQKSPNRKRNIIIGGIVFILIVLISIYFYVNRLDESNLESLKSALVEELKENIVYVTFSKSDEEPLKYEGLKRYSYDLNLSTYDLSLDEDGIFEIFNTTLNFLGNEMTGQLIDCGKNKYCAIDNISVMKFESKSSNSYSYTLTNPDTKKQLSEHSIDFFSSVDGDYTSESITAHKASKSTSSNSNSTSSNELKQLEIVDKEGVHEGDYNYIRGAVKNNGDETYRYIKVKATHYDSDLNVVDTEWTYAVSSEGLKPNEQKQFEIMTRVRNKEDYVKFRLEIIEFQ